MENITNRNITKRLSVWAILVALILMIPLFANAPWTPGDFVFAAILLFGSAFVYEFATRNMINKNKRIVVGVVVLGVLLFVWAGAATGFQGIIDRF